MKKLTNDQFAKFMFAQSEKINNYNFDLFHDIRDIVNYCYNCDNYRDETRQIITNKPVIKTYIFFVRPMGTYLFDVNDISNINHVENNCEVINKYKIEITLNHSYLYNEEFAKVTKLK